MEYGPRYTPADVVVNISVALLWVAAIYVIWDWIGY